MVNQTSLHLINSIKLDYFWKTRLTGWRALVRAQLESSKNPLRVKEGFYLSMHIKEKRKDIWEQIWDGRNTHFWKHRALDTSSPHEIHFGVEK